MCIEGNDDGTVLAKRSMKKLANLRARMIDREEAASEAASGEGGAECNDEGMRGKEPYPGATLRSDDYDTTSSEESSNSDDGDDGDSGDWSDCDESDDDEENPERLES